MHPANVCINRWARALLFVLLLVQVVYGNVTSTCGKSDVYLDIAIDMIIKAKTNKPVGLPESSNLTATPFKPMDCEEIAILGKKQSGVYTVWPRNRVIGDRRLDVYCDMDTDGGGWTVLQRRGNFSKPKDYFFKDWISYRNGFGDVKEDFWLGNENIFALTNQRLYSIRFDLKAVDGEERYALYDKFWIDNEKDKYTLHIQDYSGNAGDSMIPQHDNKRFSTRDRDHDNNNKLNCAESFKGGWWYNSCHETNLNGLYLYGKHESYADGIQWMAFRGFHESLDTVDMKIRPKVIARPLATE